MHENRAASVGRCQLRARKFQLVHAALIRFVRLWLYTLIAGHGSPPFASSSYQCPLPAGKRRMYLSGQRPGRDANSAPGRYSPSAKCLRP
ncbi:Uncharacterised protein [Mycobacteroides abscessus subsp. abscessus]|nr:Uncharacterised protein [Mycobacteroides abscessus subsp. abscessus]